MDPTTVMAIGCSVLVFAGWLFLPHSPSSINTIKVSDERVSEEREPVRVSA